MIKRLIVISALAIALTACEAPTPDTASPEASEPAIDLESPLTPPPETPVATSPTPAVQPQPTPEPPTQAEPKFSEVIRADYAAQDLARFNESATVGDSPVAMATAAFAAEVLEEGRYSEEIESDVGQERAVVIFTQNNLADDSVKDMRYRAEYAKLTEQWQLVWVGFQSRCREGRGHQDWAKELCS